MVKSDRSTIFCTRNLFGPKMHLRMEFDFGVGPTCFNYFIVKIIFSQCIWHPIEKQKIMFKNLIFENHRYCPSTCTFFHVGNNINSVWYQSEYYTVHAEKNVVSPNKAFLTNLIKLLVVNYNERKAYISFVVWFNPVRDASKDVFWLLLN